MPSKHLKDIVTKAVMGSLFEGRPGREVLDHRYLEAVVDQLIVELAMTVVSPSGDVYPVEPYCDDDGDWVWREPDGSMTWVDYEDHRRLATGAKDVGAVPAFVVRGYEPTYTQADYTLGTPLVEPEPPEKRKLKAVKVR